MRGGIDETEDWFHVEMKWRADLVVEWFKSHILREAWTLEKWVWKWHLGMIEEVTRR